MGALVPTGLVERVVWPLHAVRSDPASMQRTLARLGIRAPISVSDVDGLSWIGDLLVAVDAVTTASRQLQVSENVAEAVAAVGQAIDEVDAALRSLSSVTPSGFFDAEVMARIAADLPGLLVAEAIAAMPGPAAVARLLGLLTTERVPVDPDGPSWQQPARRHHFDLGELPAAVADPVGRVRDRWGWRPGAVDADAMISDLLALTRLLGWRARRERIPDVAADLVTAESRWRRRAAVLPIFSGLVDGDTRFVEIGLVVSPIDSANGSDSGLYVGTVADYPPLRPLRLGRDWTIDASVVEQVGLALSPGSTDLVVGTAGDPVTLELRSERVRQLALGPAELTVPGFALAIDLAPEPEPSFGVRLSTATGEPMTLVLDPALGSSFLQQIVGGPFEFDIDLELGWSSSDGFRLGAATGFDLTLPLGLQLGVVTLDSLTLALEPGLADAARISSRLTASAAVGIVAMSVEGIGVALDLTPSDSMLPAIGVDVLAPTGIGFAIATDVASGGGFLSVDPANGEYTGIIDVEVLGVGISAVVIIDTDVPGVDGWSMFLALFLELPSIQLGFGFTLNGVGGLAGINRAIDVEALQAAVRSGAMGAILFPENPIGAAPQTISELQAIFPPAADTYVFGPVVKIGWGTPPIIEAELGIVIQVPAPIVLAILGSVTAVLPSEDVELVALRLDVAGVIDAGAGTLSIDASLHDSHVVGFALAGDMALRASFSDSRSFLLSLGGFHPAFDPPAGFPTLQRLSLGIDAGSVLSVSFECYFALTSNTVQFGAAFALEANVLGFGVSGGASFDALIQFSPFQLTTNIGFHVAIKAVGVDLAGVWLAGSLTGPNPWHVVGTATFKVLFVEKDIRIDELIGSREADPLPSDPGILNQLVVELERIDNWRVVDAGAGAGVVLGESTTGTAGELVARPDATLEVCQTLVPLGLRLDRFSNAPVGDQHTFSIDVTDGDLAPAGDVHEWFAVGQFLELTPAEKLAAPSFESMLAGLRFGSEAIAADAGRAASLAHKEYTLDPEFAIDHPVQLGVQFTKTERLAGDVAHVQHSATTSRGFHTTGDDVVRLSGPSYVLTDTHTLERSTPYASWSAARQARTTEQVVVSL